MCHDPDGHSVNVELKWIASQCIYWHMYFGRWRSISFCNAQWFSFWMHSQPGQSCWMSLNIVHSFLYKKAAWLHCCVVAMAQVYKSLILYKRSCFSLLFFTFSPSLHSFLPFFLHLSLFLPLSFTFHLSKLSCGAQTLTWRSVFFSLAKLDKCSSRSLASYLHWGRCQQERAESSLALLSAWGWHWAHQREHWASSFRHWVLSVV